MNNNYYQSPKASKLMRLFWKACGADRYILERSTYSDQIKYFCLGGIVIATGVLAGLAGGYAIYTIFEPKGKALDNLVTTEAIQTGAETADFIHFPSLLIAIIFGIIWGLVIFNIDRFIVTSTGKGDGTEKITRQEFFGAIPRIIMGLIIALTISKPIEIRMFKSEIDAALEIKQDEYLRVLDDQTDHRIDLKVKTKKELIADEKHERDSINLAINKQENAIKAANDMLIKQIRGEIPPYQTGCGTACKAERARLLREENQLQLIKNNISDRLELLNKNISIHEEDIEDLENLRAEEKERNKIKKYSMDGLLLRLQLAHEVAGFWISLFITLLFVVIELTPIFFKMMLIKGPYDYMDENIRELAKAEAGIEVEYDFYKDKDGMERHKIINHGAELKRKERIAMIKAQEELNDAIINEWKAKKKEDIKNNPDKYIQED